MTKYIDGINEQNFILSGESALETEKLLQLPYDEYLTHLDTFIRVTEKRAEAIEKAHGN